jgi:hypothetical protein
LVAIKKYGYTLRLVKEQTMQICLEAVKKDRLALKYVKEQAINLFMTHYKLTFL